MAPLNGAGSYQLLALTPGSSPKREGNQFTVLKSLALRERERLYPGEGEGYLIHLVKEQLSDKRTLNITIHTGLPVRSACPIPLRRYPFSLAVH